MNVRILLVDDDENVLSSYSRNLRKRWEIVTAPGGEAGLRAMEEKGPFAVVVSDFAMPHMDGVKFLAKVRLMCPDTVRIMLTGEGDFERAIYAVNEGNIFRFLLKPCPQDQWIKAIEDGAKQYQLIQNEKESRELEVRVAYEIQKRLLLGQPPGKISGGSIGFLTIPSMRVDGDFLDFFDHSEDCLDVLIGDVMGKGIQAALIGAGAKSCFSRVLNRLYIREKTLSPPEPARIIHEVKQDLGIQLEDLEKYLTLCYCRFDFRRGKATFVDAGHTPTLVFSPTQGKILRLKSENKPLGLFSDLETYTQQSLEISGGDVFLVYSDGVTDNPNQAGEYFGIDGLEKILWEHHQEPPQKLLEIMLEKIKAFSGKDVFQDDLTAIVVKVDAPHPS